MADDARPTRRGFLDWLLALCGTITAIVAAVPAVVYLWPVTSKGPGGGRQEVKGAENLAPWESTTAVLSGKPVIILRTAGGLVAYSAACTHLGCIVHWSGDKRAFLCPCHAAAFDLDGQVTDGPPPTPLRPYKVIEAGGKVFISEA